MNSELSTPPHLAPMNDTDLIQRLKRIHRLSEQAPTPAYAYRHLEHIHALAEMTLRQLTGEELPSSKDASLQVNDYKSPDSVYPLRPV